jgi:hypothetical protein
VHAGEPRGSETELPLVAKSAIQEMDRTIQQAKKKAVDKLRVAMRAEMQAGNLAKANRINQEILRISDQQTPEAEGEPKEVVAGEWRRRTASATCFRRGA